tara:strand:- start:818 stop:1909 length:1092 start_codon:yes stop_codon:yes gene_type:complete
MEKIDVLIIDDSYSKIKFEKPISSITIKKNEFFLIPLVKGIIDCVFSFNFSRKNLSRMYFKNLVNFFSPKIVLGHEMNSRIFLLKEDFPDLITIVYQLNNYYDYYKDIVPEIINERILKKNFECDYLILKNDISKKYLNFIKSKKIVLGSVKNNEIITKNNSKKKYDIMFISTFRRSVSQHKGLNYIAAMDSNDASNSFICDILGEFAKKNKLKIAVALSSLRKEKKGKINIIDELNFFKSNIKKFFYEKNLNSYQLAEKAKIIVNVGSSLGVDLFSRGHKVLFFQPIDFMPADIIEPINKQKKTGEYWYRGCDKEIINKKIKNLLKIKSDSWKKIKNDKLQIYDPNNITLKKIIHNILNRYE